MSKCQGVPHNAGTCPGAKPTRDQHVQTEESTPHEEACPPRQAGSPESCSHQDLTHRRGWRHEYQVVHGRIVDWSPDGSETENDGYLSNLLRPSDSRTSTSDLLKHSQLPSNLADQPKRLVAQSLPVMQPRPPGEAFSVFSDFSQMQRLLHAMPVNARNLHDCNCKSSRVSYRSPDLFLAPAGLYGENPQSGCSGHPAGQKEGVQLKSSRSITSIK